MNILYICGSNPASATTGSELRTRQLYRSLSKLGTVYVLCFADEVADCPEKRIRKPVVRSKHRFLRRILHSLVCRLFNFVAPSCPKWFPSPVPIDMDAVFPGIAFDLVVERYMMLAGRIWPWRYGPLWIDVDDHPRQVHELIDAPRRGAFRRFLADRLMRKYIRRILGKCEGCWLSNPDQVPAADEGSKWHLLENIPPELPPWYKADAGRSCALLTVGHMKYIPNAEGVMRFVKEIWPLAKRKHPELEYWIAGSGLPDDCVREIGSCDGVRYLGFVENVDLLYEKALAAVVPVYAGGGTCIKTMEALSRSRVCLSTAFGARGIAREADCDCGVLQYKTAEDFVLQLKKVFSIDRIKLESTAKEYADARFSEATFDMQCRVCIGESRK